MFRGSFTALITPFSSGKLDEAALKAVIEHQIESGTHGLVPAGTTGESPTMSHEEHRRVIEITVETAAGRVPVMAGTGSNNTIEAIALHKFAKSVGADAGLVVAPYYNKPSQDGLVAHYHAIADAVDLPIFVYNIPGRSIVDISVETMARIASHPNVIGVKDATGEVERVTRHRNLIGHDFIQLSGEDASALGYNAHGGHGCISVTANVAPRLCAAFQEATLAGDYARALDYQDKLMPLHVAIFLEPGVAGAKYAMSRLGLCSDAVRLPLVGLTDATKARVDAALTHAGLI